MIWFSFLVFFFVFLTQQYCSMDRVHKTRARDQPIDAHIYTRTPDCVLSSFAHIRLGAIMALCRCVTREGRESTGWLFLGTGRHDGVERRKLRDRRFLTAGHHEGK